MCARARLQGVLLHPISHQYALVLVLVIVRERVRHGAHAQGPLPAFASLPFSSPSLLRCLLQARCLGVSLTEFRVSFPKGPKKNSILKRKKTENEILEASYPTFTDPCDHPVADKSARGQKRRKTSARVWLGEARRGEVRRPLCTAGRISAAVPRRSTRRRRESNSSAWRYERRM